MNTFVYESLPLRVLVGAGALARIADEVARLNAHQVLLIGTPTKTGEADRVKELLGAHCVACFNEAAPHVPIEIANRVCAIARDSQADAVIALGGGSTIGLAKAVAVERKLPILAVPTTYSGSEVTPIYGMTENGIKRGLRDPLCLAKTVIYDPDLIVSLPAMLSLTSAMNAVAHSVEALYAKDANPVTSLMAEESIRAIAESLPIIMDNPADLDARALSFYGSWLAGMALGTVGMALHHKLCHTLGGGFGLPHAETHTVVLPYATAFNAQAAPQAMVRVARALKVPHAAAGLYDFVKRLGGPVSLKEIGMRESDLDRAADMACEAPYYNPRPVDRSATRSLLNDAFHGRRPEGI